MVTIIFAENSAANKNWARIFNSLRGSQSLQILSLAAGSASSIEGAHVVPASANGTGRRIETAVNMANSSMLLFIDSRVEMSEADGANIIHQVSGMERTIAYAPLAIGQDSIDLPDLEADRLISSITTTAAWPTAVVAVPKAFMAKMDFSAMTSIPEALASAMTLAACENEAISRMDIELGMPISPESYSACQLTNAEISRALQIAVNNARVEDLFPNNPWSSHSEEAAAAVYHELAAKFLKLSDIASAEECLAHSDKFDEGPRSLALRGIIALIRGETLGAVANMVSSLQQYELRKQNSSDSRYITFSPNNLEVINSNLNKGLEALNRRDNDSALSFFTEAVFEFDPFFRNLGIEGLAQ